MATINELANIIFNLNENEKCLNKHYTMENLYMFLKTCESLIDKKDNELEQFIKKYPQMQVLSLYNKIERQDKEIRKQLGTINKLKNGRDILNEQLKRITKERDIMYIEQYLNIDISIDIEERLDIMKEYFEDEGEENIDFTMEEYKEHIGYE